jgi:hypothetical protein
MRRDIVWEWADRPGLEHLALDIRADGITADGLVVVQFDSAPLRLRYTVRCEGTWRVREASLALDRGGERSTIEIRRDDLDHWIVDGAARPDLDGCTEIDIMATPFTNTLPIRRLSLAPDAATPLRVVYVRIPDLSIEAIDQEYTRLDPAEPPGRFRYRSLVSGFTAELAVDRDGIVQDYPGIWHRRSG